VHQVQGKSSEAIEEILLIAEYSLEEE